MKIYDVSMPIYNGMTVYKDAPEKQPQFETKTNGYVTDSYVRMNVHTGTHIDAPLHMIANGQTVEQYPIERLVGKCKVFDLTGVVGQISKKEIVSLPIERGDNILFKTKNSFEDHFNFEFVYVDESAAKFLAQQEINLVGIDALGIERAQAGHLSHKAFLGNETIILEGLRLAEVPEGTYLLVVAPLKLIGTEASPARVLLVED